MKILKMLFVFCMAAGMLFGCGKKDTAVPAPSTTEAKQAITVGLCVRQYDAAAPYYDKLKTMLEEEGYTVTLADGKKDQSRQDTQVTDLITEGCSILVVEPVMVSALDTVMGKVKAAQIPVLFLDHAPAAELLEGYEKAAYIGARGDDAGAAQAALLEKLPMGGDGNGDGVVSYVMLRGPEDHLDAMEITEACTNALPEETTNCLTTVVADWTLESGRAACSGAISQFGPDIEVIFCNSPQLALGAAQAVKNRGWQPGKDMYVLAIGNSEELTAAIARQDVAATVDVNLQEKYGAILAAVEAMQTPQLPPKYQYMGFGPGEGS